MKVKQQFVAMALISLLSLNAVKGNWDWFNENIGNQLGEVTKEMVKDIQSSEGENLVDLAVNILENEVAASKEGVAIEEMAISNAQEGNPNFGKDL